MYPKQGGPLRTASKQDILQSESCTFCLAKVSSNGYYTLVAVDSSVDVGLKGVLYHSGNLGDTARVQAYTGVDNGEIFSQVPGEICGQVKGNRLEPASAVGSALMVMGDGCNAT